LYINAQQTHEGNVEIYFMPDVSEIPEPLWFHKINIGCNGTENNHTFSRACEPLLNWKFFIKLLIVVIHDYGTFTEIKLFEHAYELLNLIGNSVKMEGNRKMTGCLQTFGGHCT